MIGVEFTKVCRDKETREKHQNYDTDHVLRSNQTGRLALVKTLSDQRVLISSIMMTQLN